MPEAYVWNEGQIALWTGTATASAIVAYAQNIQAPMAWGWMEHETVDGGYQRHLTGQSFDITFGAIYTYDATIVRMALSATAVHMRLNHSSVNGSAGFMAYSGHISGLSLAGDETNPYTYTLSYHTNVFSAYGG